VRNPSLMPLVVMAAVLAVGSACTCAELVELEEPVRRAEAWIPLGDATPATRDAVWTALAAEGVFGGGAMATPTPCVSRTLWPLEGDEAVALHDDRTHRDADCASPVQQRQLRLFRHLERRPDKGVPPGRGFERPRLTATKQWMGIGWSQRHELDAVRDADPFVKLGPLRIDERLPRTVARADLPRPVQIRTWNYPPWTFGRSTYKVQVHEHDCVADGATVGQLVLTLSGGDNVWIPGPGTRALERVIARLGDTVTAGLAPPDLTRCGPLPPTEDP